MAAVAAGAPGAAATTAPPPAAYPMPAPLAGPAWGGAGAADAAPPSIATSSLRFIPSAAPPAPAGGGGAAAAGALSSPRPACSQRRPFTRARRWPPPSSSGGLCGAGCVGVGASGGNSGQRRCGGASSLHPRSRSGRALLLALMASTTTCPLGQRLAGRSEGARRAAIASHAGRIPSPPPPPRRSPELVLQDPRAAASTRPRPPSRLGYHRRTAGPSCRRLQRRLWRVQPGL